MKKIILLACLGLGQNPFYAQITWKSVSAGAESGHGLRSDGSIWAWGANLNGQLGTGSTLSTPFPEQMGSDKDWKALYVGSIHAMALKTDGSLWAWGANGAGQLGLGSTSNTLSPTQIGTDTDWQKIALGQGSSFGIKSDGSLWAWGFNSSGQLGDGSINNKLTPVRIGTDNDWQMISAGGYHTLALKNDGSLWATGLNATGQLGDSTNINSTTFKQISSDQWKCVAAGFEFSCGLKMDGSIWSWGYNANGQLGLDSVITIISNPLQIGNATNWDTIVAGSGFAFAINELNQLYGWGFNLYGNLGTGNTTNFSFPSFIISGAKQISASPGFGYNGMVYGFHGLMIKTNSQDVICASGINYTGQLGNGGTSNQDVFTCQSGLIDQNALDEYELADLKIYPNPVNQLLYLESAADITSVSIYAMDGQQILFLEAPFAYLDLSSFEAGMYQLEITARNNQKARKSFVKMN